MGQKVHPKGLRLKIVEDWDSKWFADGKDYTTKLSDDFKIYKFLDKELQRSNIAKVSIERYAKKVKVVIHSSRPAAIIGPKGVNKEKLERKLKAYLNRDDISVFVKDVKSPEVVAQLVAERVAQQLEKRVAFRRAMKKSIDMAMKKGAKGIKVSCSGRLGGAEMARTEWYLEGRVPLHTLRAKIDYGFAEANTKVGKVGVKVWIFMKEIIADEMTSIL
jgi:small subunit ribosomal protein S3